MPDISSWHDYFVMVGGGSAALTGLVFVAMTLHLNDIIQNPVHRHRARTILAGLTAVFIRCALVLMGGQDGRAVATELFGVLVVVELILWVAIVTVTTIVGLATLGVGCVLSLFAIVAWVGVLALHIVAIIRGINGERLIIPGVSEYADRL